MTGDLDGDLDERRLDELPDERFLSLGTASELFLGEDDLEKKFGRTIRKTDKRVVGGWERVGEG